MKTKILYAITVIVAVSLDAYTTYLRTPDLARELNPLIIALGRNWTAVWVVNLLTVGLLFGAFVFLSKRTKEFAQFPASLSKVEFSSYDYFLGKQHWANVSFKLPTRSGASIILGSGIVAFGLPIFRFIVATSNYLLTVSSKYAALLNIKPMLVFSLYAIFSIYVGLLLLNSFRFRAYRQSR